jgi:hypothetical protein
MQPAEPASSAAEPLLLLAVLRLTLGTLFVWVFFENFMADRAAVAAPLQAG